MFEDRSGVFGVKTSPLRRRPQQRLLLRHFSAADSVFWNEQHRILTDISIHMDFWLEIHCISTLIICMAAFCRDGRQYDGKTPNLRAIKNGAGLRGRRRSRRIAGFLQMLVACTCRAAGVKDEKGQAAATCKVPAAVCINKVK